MDDLTYTELGYRQALANNTKRAQHITALDGFREATKPGTDAHGMLMKLACELAANVFIATSKTPAPDFHQVLTQKAAAQETWNTELDWIGDACLAAFAASEKRSGVGTMATEMLTGALKGSPDAIMALAGLSALGGSSLGALGWAMNRDSEHDDAEVEALKARTAKYEELTARLNEELRARNPYIGAV
jgi:hypothetical protein